MKNYSKNRTNGVIGQGYVHGWINDNLVINQIKSFGEPSRGITTSTEHVFR